MKCVEECQLLRAPLGSGPGRKEPLITIAWLIRTGVASWRLYNVPCWPGSIVSNKVQSLLTPIESSHIACGDSSSDRSLLLCRGFEVEEGGKKAVSHFIVYDHIILQSEALTWMSERALILV